MKDRVPRKNHQTSQAGPVHGTVPQRPVTYKLSDNVAMVHIQANDELASEWGD